MIDRRTNSFRQFVLFMLLHVAALMPTLAQDSIPAGRIVLRGEVVDPAGVPVVGAVVSLRGARRAATTNTRGEFSLDRLPAGQQVVEVRAFSYRDLVFTVDLVDSMPQITISLIHTTVVLDSVKVVEKRQNIPASRNADRISEAELSRPDIVGGNAMLAFEMLRPLLFQGRPSGGTSATTEASTRRQFYGRDERLQTVTGKSKCVGNPACDIDGLLSVSINEGPLGSPDVLTTLSARFIKEMRYLRAVEATARFGQAAGSGPVLIVYTK